MKPKSRIQQIGIDRIVRLEWLERAAQLALAGNHPSTVRHNMDDELVMLKRLNKSI